MQCSDMNIDTKFGSPTQFWFMDHPCKNQLGSCIFFSGTFVTLTDLQKLSIKLKILQGLI